MKGFSRERFGKGLFRPRKGKATAFQRRQGGGIFNRQPDAAGGLLRRIMHHTSVPELCENEETLIEYVDEQGRPLLIAPPSEAFSLRKKAVGVILCDSRGRAFVRRRTSEEGVETWALSAETFIRSGEAKDEAAERAVRETPGLSNLASGLAVSATFKLTEGLVSLTLFLAELTEGLSPASLPEGHFLDHEELGGMAESFPDLFSPALLWAIRTGCLEKHRKARISTR